MTATRKIDQFAKRGYQLPAGWSMIGKGQINPTRIYTTISTVPLSHRHKKKSAQTNINPDSLLAVGKRHALGQLGLGFSLASIQVWLADYLIRWAAKGMIHGQSIPN
jgi:hypothetical protein